MAKNSIKKSVSFRPDVYEIAEDMADKYFGGNFSAYLTYLICADKHGLTRVKETEESAEIKEEIRDAYVKSEENEAFIDQFLEM